MATRAPVQPVGGRPRAAAPAAGPVHVVADAHVLLFARGTAARTLHAAPPSGTALGYALCLLALWVLNLADLVLTVYWTGSVGWAAEGNLFLRHVAHLTGALGFALYKVALMTFVVLSLWWLFRRFEAAEAAARVGWRLRALAAMRAAAFALTGILLLFYVWVVWHNLRITGWG